MRETPVTPVAVVDSPEALWSAVVRGDDLVTEAPAGRWDAVLDDIAGFDPEHRLLLETGYSTRFPTSARSHYARVVASSNECCSDTRSRGCDGGVAKTMEALTDAVVAPIFLAPPAPTSRGIFLQGAASTGRTANEPVAGQGCR